MEMATDISQSKVLVTIIYKTPDYPHLIQEFNYEGFDVPPDYPYFDKFMDYWRNNIPSIILDIKGLCCLLYTSPSPRDRQKSRMPSSA